MSKADELFQENCRGRSCPRVRGTRICPSARGGRMEPLPIPLNCSAWSTATTSGRSFPSRPSARMYLKSAVDELLWIWQKKSNNIHDLNSSIWDAWGR